MVAFHKMQIVRRVVKNAWTTQGEDGIKQPWDISARFRAAVYLRCSEVQLVQKRKWGNNRSIKVTS